MDAAAELGRNPISKHQIQPEYGDGQDDAGRDGRTRLTRPSSQARTGTGGYSFSLFSCPRAGLVILTRLIHTLLYVMTIHLSGITPKAARFFLEAAPPGRRWLTSSLGRLHRYPPTHDAF